MSPKETRPNEDQGALFAEHIISTGATDPTMHTTSVELEAVPDGVYPEAKETAEPELSPEDKTALEGLRKARQTDRRHTAQVGKHSPLERDGSYSSIKAGDFLPGFGPVTYTNFADAQRHADRLEADRQNRRR